jgi:hypothetical protein
VEKRSIKVEDVAFVIVGLEVRGQGNAQTVGVMTNLGELVIIDAEHPLRFAPSPAAGGIAVPYVRVRGRLEARVGRAVFPDLVALGTVETHNGADWFGLWSSGEFWPLMPADEVGM